MLFHSFNACLQGNIFKRLCVEAVQLFLRRFFHGCFFEGSCFFLGSFFDGSHLFFFHGSYFIFFRRSYFFLFRGSYFFLFHGSYLFFIHGINFFLFHRSYLFFIRRSYFFFFHGDYLFFLHGSYFFLFYGSHLFFLHGGYFFFHRRCFFLDHRVDHIIIRSLNSLLLRRCLDLFLNSLCRTAFDGMHIPRAFLALRQQHAV
mmetsp:Transcript_24953/g.46000  ORF Transcript_24953/g.46000 Transcript_24953/m.46000 type:complete len:201 (+) Transcript_24953:823-1425(+)